MSDFFAGVSGARFPDVVMNQGPLPGMGGLPAPLHDTADGRINYNNSLLGDLEPYAYGEPGYLSSQNSYLNIPHKIQKIVPFLFLPNPDGTDSFRLNHPIDDGDIAFTLRLDRNSEVCGGLNSKSVQRYGLGTAIDPMINLCTLNYILAGLQLCTPVQNLREKWDRLLHYLDSSRYRGDGQQAYGFADIKRVVRHLVRPFGIAHGSEKQGGQHEGSLSAVTWPVSFVISLTLDGKDANMVNIWHKHDVEAGSDLVLRLKPVPIPPGGKYTLNHWGKGLVEKVFTPNTLRALEDALHGAKPTHIWQLVPDLFSLDFEPSMPEDASTMAQAMHGLVPAFRPAEPDAFCWQEEGYWHVARAQIHSRKYGLEEYYYNDMANNLRTGHMDVTFQPTYCTSPFRHFNAQDGGALPVDQPQGQRARNVFNLIGAEAPGGGESQGPWRSSLRLERSFEGGRRDGGGGNARNAGDKRRHDDEDGGDDRRAARQRQPGASASLASPMVPISQVSLREGPTFVAVSSMAPADMRGDFIAVDHRGLSASPASVSVAPHHVSVSHHIPVSHHPVAHHAVHTGTISGHTPVASHLLESGLTEDIGTFEEGGPTRQAPESHLFSVAKPGLSKAPKRPMKSRPGIMGSVLSADGSVTREQSRML